jgi:ribosomal protein uS3
MSTVKKINRKKKFVADGVFQAELHSFFSRALDDCGYSGFELTATLPKPEIRIRATKVKALLENGDRKMRELESVIQKRFGYGKDGISLTVERIQKKGLCAAAMAESLKLKLVNQVPLRLAANSVIKQALAEEAKGCEVIISGKLQQQRAKSMKFKQGYMISSGQPKLDYLDVAVRHVFFKQGIMGVKVKIMKNYDPNNKQSANKPLPDFVEIADPKKDDNEERIFSRVDDQHR